MSGEVIINKNIFAKEGAEESLKDVILNTAIEVHKNATSNAPTDTGALRNSLMWRTSWDGDGGHNSQGGEKSDEKLSTRPRGSEGIVGSAQDYATYQEFGTRNMAAQPYLRPAGDAVRGATASEIAKKWGREAMAEEFKQRKTKTRKL